MKTLTLKEAAQTHPISLGWLRHLCEVGRVVEAHRVARGWRPERWLLTMEDELVVHILPPPRQPSRKVQILRPNVQKSPNTAKERRIKGG